MKFESAQQLVPFLEGIKTQTQEIVAQRNSTLLSWNQGRPYVTLDGVVYELHYEGLKQFLHRVDKYACATYNMVHAIKNNRDDNMSKTISVLNAVIQEAPSANLKFYLVDSHAINLGEAIMTKAKPASKPALKKGKKKNVDDMLESEVAAGSEPTAPVRVFNPAQMLVLGAVSQNHPRIFDADIFNMVAKTAGGEDKMHKAYWHENVTTMSFTMDTFHDPIGLEWDLGIRIENNEFGRHMLRILPEVSRQVCTNGATIVMAGTVIEFMHTKNFSVERFQNAFSNVTEKLTVAKETIVKSLDFKYQVSDEKIFWEKIRGEFKFTKKDVDSIRLKLEKEDEKVRFTAYGLGNAVSALANDYQKDVEHYLALQDVAGSIYTQVMKV